MQEPEPRPTDCRADALGAVLSVVVDVPGLCSPGGQPPSGPFDPPTVLGPRKPLPLSVAGPGDRLLTDRTRQGDRTSP